MPPPPQAWIATEGTVTSCKYQFARMNTFTLGIPTQGKFRVTFDYYAHGQLYSDELQSPVAIAQNETIELSYNPLNPRQNSRTGSRGEARPVPLYVIGIAGSMLLSFIWLLMLRGCAP